MTGYLLANADVRLWSTIWLAVLIMGAAVFLAVLLYAVIAGAADIRDLLTSLSGEQKTPDREDRSEGDA